MASACEIFVKESNGGEKGLNDGHYTADYEGAPYALAGGVDKIILSDLTFHLHPAQL